MDYYYTLNIGVKEVTGNKRKKVNEI